MMPEITFTIAFIAGLLSFLSPCLLPMVPVYIAYLAGDTGFSSPVFPLSLYFLAPPPLLSANN